MKLSEQIDAEYDKANALDGWCDVQRDTLMGWKNEAARLEATNTELLEALEGCAEVLRKMNVQWDVLDKADEAIRKAKS